MFLIFATAAYVLICAAYLSVAAEEVNFQGQISSKGSFEDPTGLFAPCDSLSGFWILDTSMQDSDSSPSRGSYPQNGTPAFRIVIGSWFFQTDQINIQILNDGTIGILTVDAHDLLSGGTSVAPTSNVPDLVVQQMQWTTRDFVAPLDAVTSDKLIVVPDISRFDQVKGQITGRVDGELFFMNLELDAVAVGQILPPSSPPTAKPTTIAPIPAPTKAPTFKSTPLPTQLPTARPTLKSSEAPTGQPTLQPTSRPSAEPSTRLLSSPASLPLRFHYRR